MFAGLKNWWNQPFAENMTATKWFLFVGFLIVILAVWKVIIWHLQDV